MSLSTYKKKRDFKQTSEPAAGKSKGGKHIFVVQRHHATRLHYDFRLEIDGALKSWAVPKGPSLNPEDKRLAMEVEDHPYDYKDFQGEIPAGNYGAGYVYLWDKGTYELLESNGKAFDKEALREWRSGNLKVVLHGKKLKGEFALVKMKGRDENAWLLIKHKDKYAVTGKYNSEDHTPQRVIDKQRGSAGEKKAPAKTAAKSSAAKAAAKRPAKTASSKSAASKRPTKTASSKSAASSTKAAKKKAAEPTEQLTPMKEWYKPMLTTLVDEPFDREGWVFETKWDGYRTMANVEKGRAELYSRNQISFNEQYAVIRKAVEEIPHNVVLDGEIVVLGKKERSDFQSLQNYKTTRQGNLVYEVFDLLYLNGHDLKELTLLERKALLQEIISQLDNPLVQYSDHVATKGLRLFKKAAGAGWEGIIAKNGSSAYTEGNRSLNWLKIKVLNRQEAVVCGFTAPRGSRKKLGALVLGVYEGNKLEYIGHCGGGFNEQLLGEVHAKLQPYVQAGSPFDKKVTTNMPITWVKPVLVCEVKFSEWTGGGNLRQPIFIALREDKPAKQVKRELPKHITMAGKKASSGEITVNGTPVTAKAGSSAAAKKAATRKSAAGKKATAAKSPAGKKTAKAAAPAVKKMAAPGKGAAENDRTLTLNRQQVALTNQQKIYWPDEKITKGQLIDYYLEIADYLVPHLKDRPLSLHRFPNGINGQSFYQKDLDVKTIPSWLKTLPVHSASSNKTVDYLICNNEATLAYMINLGCIEVNPWLSRTGKPDAPDYIVIDLDPGEIDFKHVVTTANTVRAVLDEFDIRSFCKTSGATGLHIYIPTGARYPYETCRLFAEFVAREVHARLPDITSVTRAKSARVKKVYVDFLQNSKGQTIAAPYSVRPRPGATVSTPLHWEEVNKNLSIRNFHIGNTVKRLQAEGELWAGIMKVKNNLRAILKTVKNE
ncbi:DNA ligase D [Chitinophaga alhagiae]|uniref:DNA ligase (ATP) n=1 Tax=Chitinophaga alhagiae TaxID=2203219 RepID=A0ABM6WBV3_9BACT|nr:DNA ligase D [Chitinophaga alhagiae]AWO01400.1 DNA ligase D [Chitinophaga alhagiae]